MRQSNFFPIAGVLYGIYGLGLLLIPDQFMQVYGVHFESSGLLMARILGSSLFSISILLLIVKNHPFSETLKIIFISGLIYNIVDLPVVLIATLNGALNSFGWSAVILHLFLAYGFGSCYLKRRTD